MAYGPSVPSCLGRAAVCITLSASLSASYSALCIALCPRVGICVRCERLGNSSSHNPPWKKQYAHLGNLETWATFNRQYSNFFLISLLGFFCRLPWLIPLLVVHELFFFCALAPPPSPPLPGFPLSFLRASLRSLPAPCVAHRRIPPWSSGLASQETCPPTRPPHHPPSLTVVFVMRWEREGARRLVYEKGYLGLCLSSLGGGIGGK
ncbi:hypothetical protein F4802DRAFT_315799 [Xylaria palmicola]|nr:hypothetical protein F4802DRAFT_315799 [Xylaria palmicola]